MMLVSLFELAILTAFYLHHHFLLNCLGFCFRFLLLLFQICIHDVEKILIEASIGLFCNDDLLVFFDAFSKLSFYFNELFVLFAALLEVQVVSQEVCMVFLIHPLICNYKLFD